MNIHCCKVCWNVYKSDTEGDGCYLVSCLGEIISIDEGLLRTCEILNDKGYFTRFCCSGHTWQRYPRTYVQFALACAFKTLPRGFELLTRYNPHAKAKISTISKSFSRELSKVELQLELFQAARDLLEWADSLESFDKEYGFVAADDSSAEICSTKGV